MRVPVRPGMYRERYTVGSLSEDRETADNSAILIECPLSFVALCHPLPIHFLTKV